MEVTRKLVHTKYFQFVCILFHVYDVSSVHWPGLQRKMKMRNFWPNQNYLITTHRSNPKSIERITGRFSGQFNFTNGLVEFPVFITVIDKVAYINSSSFIIPIATPLFELCSSTASSSCCSLPKVRNQRSRYRCHKRKCYLIMEFRFIIGSNNDIQSSSFSLLIRCIMRRGDVRYAIKSAKLLSYVRAPLIFIGKLTF